MEASFWEDSFTKRLFSIQHEFTDGKHLIIDDMLYYWNGRMVSVFVISV